MATMTVQQPSTDAGESGGLNLAVIGNGSFSALLNARGDIVWACLPRFDSAPVFSSLLQHNPDPGVQSDQTGVYAIELMDLMRTEQRYLPNTAIVVTTLHDRYGGSLEIRDFAPRFGQYGRFFRPIMLVRQVRPIAGSPRIRIVLRPSFDYGNPATAITHGSNHVRYVGASQTLRLTTNASISTLLEQKSFILDRELTLLLGPDETISQSITDTGNRFFERTREHWHRWVRALAIPFEWQHEVIRAAITLKLSGFEDTGAIIAAPTTSLPEAPHSGRNWDYRYCWMRDAYFVVNSLNRLGATRMMEHYLGYIINIAANADGERLQPVYGISGDSRLDEWIAEKLPGYRGHGPVRVGNQAYAQVQNDVYGAAILAATHLFFDARLARPGDENLFKRLEKLGETAAKLYCEPDAGPWELRNSARVHTFSSVMCWVACDRLAKIAARLALTDRERYWREHADDIHADICQHAWNEEENSFVESFGGKDLDASLLLLHELGFLSADDPRFGATVAAIERHLKRGDFIFRYIKEDDFGAPETAFLICTFWYVDALAALGRTDEARGLFERLLACRNSHGLLSEDINPDTGELWGNLPQTYSMVGLINSAMRLSKSWEAAF
ncbi:MAG TPA: glycoside hydrolase family 15 protein [Gammaproteobacteria bacterium]|nr:glycoside hydrolase family 15 protein [Gammaproteobacteria bacterium]